MFFRSYMHLKIKHRLYQIHVRTEHDYKRQITSSISSSCEIISLFVDNRAMKNCYSAYETPQKKNCAKILASSHTLISGRVLITRALLPIENTEACVKFDDKPLSCLKL